MLLQTIGAVTVVGLFLAQQSCNMANLATMGREQIVQKIGESVRVYFPKAEIQCTNGKDLAIVPHVDNVSEAFLVKMSRTFIGEMQPQMQGLQGAFAKMVLSHVAVVVNDRGSADSTDALMCVWDISRMSIMACGTVTEANQRTMRVYSSAETTHNPWFVR